MAIAAFVGCSKSNNDEGPTIPEGTYPKEITYKDGKEKKLSKETFNIQDGKILSIVKEFYGRVGETVEKKTVKTFSYNGDLPTKSVYEGDGQAYTEEYEYESGKLTKKTVTYAGGGKPTVTTYSYEGDRLIREVLATPMKYSKEGREEEVTQYNEKDFVHSGERVTVNEKNYTKFKDGKEKYVNTLTSVFTIQGGNLMHRKTESTSLKEEGTYTYDDKKNPTFSNLKKILTPSYFMTSEGSRNNILTKEITSKAENKEESKQKYIYKYTYNDKGYPTTRKEYEVKGSVEEHIMTEEYTYSKRLYN